MNAAVFRHCTWVVVLLVTNTALAQSAAVTERYRTVVASADGIGKRCMGREISAVMGWQGAAWLELAYPYEVMASVLKRGIQPVLLREIRDAPVK